MKRVLLLIVKAYQRLISPMFPPTCRFSPSCSQYSYEAISKYGVVRGVWMSIRRIGRCNPWHSGGYDPVP